MEFHQIGSTKLALPDFQKVVKVIKRSISKGLVQMNIGNANDGKQKKGANNYRGTSLIRNRPPSENCSRLMPRDLWWS